MHKQPPGFFQNYFTKEGCESPLVTIIWWVRVSDWTKDTNEYHGLLKFSQDTVLSQDTALLFPSLWIKFSKQMPYLSFLFGCSCGYLLVYCQKSLRTHAGVGTKEMCKNICNLSISLSRLSCLFWMSKTRFLRTQSWFFSKITTMNHFCFLGKQATETNFNHLCHVEC